MSRTPARDRKVLLLFSRCLYSKKIFMSLTRSTLLIIASRILTLFAGLIVASSAALSLTEVEQGYFFSFTNLAAAQILFELGITGLILHHFSHGHASLQNARNEIELKTAKDEIWAIRSYSYRYFKKAALWFLLITGVLGSIFFGISKTDSVSWGLPWACIIIGTSIGLNNLSFHSYLAGFGKVDISYSVRIRSTFVMIVLLIFFAFAIGGLMAYPAALTICNIYAYVALRKACNNIDRSYSLASDYEPARPEFGKSQRQMAFSAIAGYIAANSVTLYTFHFFGAQSAGKVGLTVAVFMAVATLAMARTTAESAGYGHLIVKKDLDKLRQNYRLTLLYSVSFAIFLCLLLFVSLNLSTLFMPQLSARFVDNFGFVILSFYTVSAVMVAVTSTILRAFKTEELMWPSIAAAVVALSSQLVLNLDPMDCIVLSSLFNFFVFFPYATKTLLQKTNSHVK